MVESGDRLREKVGGGVEREAKSMLSLKMDG